MIPDFSPPNFVPATGQTLKNFGDVRTALSRINMWVQYVTTYIQSQLLPPLNSSTAIAGTAATTRTLGDHDADLDTIFAMVHELQAEVAALKERLNV